MKRKIFLFLIFCIIYSFGFYFVNNASASNDIGVTPSVFEELIERGEIVKKEIRVVNNSDESIVISAYAMDFKTTDESGKAELIAPNTEDGNYISSWLDITAEAIDLEPGEEKIVPFIINVPENVEAGGYYGAVVFGTEKEEENINTALILLRVTSDAQGEAIIKEFNTDKGFYTTPFEIIFNTRIKNLGNAHIKPKGMIETRNMFGKKMSVITINDESKNMLPDSERVFKNSWKENFGFGRYEASLAISFGTPVQKGGGGRKTLAIKTYFWIFPTKIIIFTTISIIILIVLFFIFLKSYKKREIRKAMTQFGVRNGHGRYVNRRHYSRTGELAKNFLIILIISLLVIAIIKLIVFL